MKTLQLCVANNSNIQNLSPIANDIIILTQEFSVGNPRAKSGPPTSVVWLFDHLWNT